MSILSSQPLKVPLLSEEPSHCTRQRLLRNSPQTEGELTLPQYTYQANPFRSISFSNPDNSALTTSLVFINEDPARHLRPEIEKLLEQHEVPPESNFRTLKASLDGSQFFFVQVLVRGENSTLIRFEPLKDDIVRLLRRNNLPDMHVEILHAEHFSPPKIHAIKSGHIIVGIFEECKHEIASILTNSLGQKWQVVCPFRVGGKDSKQAEPAIVVIVEGPVKANWFQIRARIINQMLAKEPNLRIDVEFTPGSLDTLVGKEPVSCEHRFEVIADIKMGDSIGVRESNIVGTMGGFMELKLGDRTHRGFLTSYSAVVPSSCETREVIDRTGIYPDSNIAHRDITIESIARMDREYTLANIRAVMNAIESRKATLEAEIEKQSLSMQDLRKSSLIQLDSLGVSKSKFERARQSIENMPDIFGRVLLTSGLLLHDKQVLDWAFVELTPEAEKLHFKPNIMLKIPDVQIPDFGDRLPYFPVAPFLSGCPITEFGELEKDRWYFKHGRTTDVTGGICNGSKALCNWKGSRYTVDGKECQMASHYTEQFVILGVKYNFAEPGDSGSLLLRDDGAVAGLICAEVRDSSGREKSLPVVVSEISEILGSLTIRVAGSVSLRLP
ncbi:unnamed protein product [Penicillium olsonii]|nr:unnamed protein product [Penicillium olsonii]